MNNCNDISKFNVIINHDSEKKIVFNTVTQGMMLIDNEYIEKLQDPFLLTEKEHSIFSDYGFLVNKDSDEKNLKKSYFESKFNRKRLGVTIELTNRCNFDCIYCYQPHNLADLTKSKADEFLEWIKYMLRNGTNDIKIHWFGGEPLLNIDTALYIDQAIISLKNEFDFMYITSMTTNGYLIHEYYKTHLSKMKIGQYQITLDGTIDHHNETRYLKNGVGTFDNIIKNIELLLNAGEKVVIRYNVNKKNSQIKPFLDYLINKGIFSKVGISFHRTNKFSGSQDASNFYFNSVQEYSTALLNIYTTLFEYRIKIPKYSSNGTNCQFDCSNHFLLNTSLEMIRCTSTENNDKSILGKITQGRIVQNIENISKKNKYTPFEEVKCKLCKVMPFCKGGCNLLKEMGEEECIPEKYILDEYIKLMYMEATTNV